MAKIHMEVGSGLSGSGWCMEIGMDKHSTGVVMNETI